MFIFSVILQRKSISRCYIDICGKCRFSNWIFGQNFKEKKTRQIAEPFSRTVSYLFCTVLPISVSRPWKKLAWKKLPKLINVGLCLLGTLEYVYYIIVDWNHLKKIFVGSQGEIWQGESNSNQFWRVLLKSESSSSPKFMKSTIAKLYNLGYENSENLPS